ncbi:hypothetical protein GCM10007989_34920 [Devosia pacifica]|uniref:DUF3311 domain-containing protein n=1 Tax=Devosia pacifica TaxID=1335967 RepID=A0A918VYK5_9HYPH|nr:hypothetical protein [Devosia pacifica]GHA35910.1 hypothetical protein GCM10007989_34920 [Devosia pacifica]
MRGKLESTALLLTLASILLIMPPIAYLFQWQARLFGVPVEVIYLFTVWGGLVLCSALLSRRLPPQTPPSGDDDGGSG